MLAIVCQRIVRKNKKKEQRERERKCMVIQDTNYVAGIRISNDVMPHLLELRLLLNDNLYVHTLTVQTLLYTRGKTAYSHFIKYDSFLDQDPFWSNNPMNQSDSGLKL